MVQYRDPSFIAYYWHREDVDEASDLQETVNALVFSSSQQARCEAFLELLHSGNPAAQGIAMDNYTYNQTLRRWGIDNEFKPCENEIADVAREQLRRLPVTALTWNKGSGLFGANYASAFLVLSFLAKEADCSLIEPLLRTLTHFAHPEILDNAWQAIKTGLEGSQTLYPDILQDLRHLVFETDLSDAEMVKVAQKAVYSLWGYKLRQAEEILLEALQHENYKISAQAAEVLVYWDLPKYFEQIQAVASNWPESGEYPMRGVTRQLEEYLDPSEPEPELTEEEKRQIQEERHRDNVERLKTRELEWYYPGGFQLYFWSSLRDLAISNKEMRHLVHHVSRVLMDFDGDEHIDQILQLLQSDFVPAKCAAFEIFAFHHTLGRYGVSNPFVRHSAEVLAQARLQLRQPSITSHGSGLIGNIVGANHASALLVLKYLGDSSDLPAVEEMIQISQDVNVLFQGWQAIRHCSGQPDAYYPHLITNAEIILLDRRFASILQWDVMNLFYEYKVESVENILVRAAEHENELSLTPEIQVEAAWILLQWNLSKYIEVVRESVNYFFRAKNLQSYALSESHRMIQEYDQISHPSL